MNRFVDWEIRTPMKIWIVVLSGWYANSHTLRIHWRSILLSRVLILYFSLSICQHCHGFFHLWYSIPISVDFVCRYLSSWGRFNKPCPAQRNGHVWRIFFIVIFCLTSTAIISFANNCCSVASTFSLVMIVVCFLSWHSLMRAYEFLSSAHQSDICPLPGWLHMIVKHQIPTP